MMHRGDIVIIAQRGVYEGKPRPAALRPKVDGAHWPEQLSDPALYEGETFMGPLG